MRRQGHQSGFSTTVILLVVLVVTALVVAGVVVPQHHKPISAIFSASTSQTQATTQPQSTVTQSTQPSTYQGWNTYNDTGHAAASGISIKYPSDWQINLAGNKKIGNTKNPTVVIYEREIFLPSSETPQEEWNTCATNVSADACGAASGDKTITSSVSTINGLAAYMATMQNSSGTYHVTVIRGNKSTPPAGAPFVELTTRSGDPTALSSYAAVMASATFPN